MTKLSALGASLLILSLAAPAWADESKPAPPKAVAAPAKAAKPPTPKAPTPMAKTSGDHAARHAEDDDHQDRKDRDHKHDKARRHDRG